MFLRGVTYNVWLTSFSLETTGNHVAKPFKVESKYQPAGDQPQAIEKLVEGIQAGLASQTLLGVTGSGKTFTMAHVV